MSRRASWLKIDSSHQYPSWFSIYSISFWDRDVENSDYNAELIFAVMKCCSWGGLKNRNVLPHTSRDGCPRSACWGGWFGWELSSWFARGSCLLRALRTISHSTYSPKVPSSHMSLGVKCISFGKTQTSCPYRKSSWNWRGGRKREFPRRRSHLNFPETNDFQMCNWDPETATQKDASLPPCALPL